VSIVAIVLLLAAVALVVAAEWQHVAGRIGGTAGGRPRARRPRRKQHLRVVSDEPDDDFARSVERDLAALPTIDERDRKR
jgi:hypothetical protein